MSGIKFFFLSFLAILWKPGVLRVMLAKKEDDNMFFSGCQHGTIAGEYNPAELNHLPEKHRVWLV